jgi:hypothetical protein
VGSAVDRLVEDTAKRCPDPEACEKRGVFVVVSQDPALIQVRTGSDLAAQARWAGVTAGSEYMARQQLPVRQMVEWLSSSLPNATDLSWFRRLILMEVTQNLYSELEELSLPSDGFYGHYILEPFLRLSLLAQRYSGTWWVAYVIASALALALKYVLRKIMKAIVGPAPGKIANSILLISTIAIGLGLAVPSAASAILLSGSRLEDQLALRASGIPGAELFVFPAESFTIRTGILLALLLMLVRFLKGAAAAAPWDRLASLPDETQQRMFADATKNDPAMALLLEAAGTSGDSDKSRDFERAPYEQILTETVLQGLWASIRWALLAWLFLPKAMTLVAMCFWILPIAKGGLDYFVGRSRERR